MLMLVRPVQPLNALDPMLVTLSGMVTLVRLLQDWNAPFPMLVTGYPPSVSTITSAPVSVVG